MRRSLARTPFPTPTGAAQTIAPAFGAPLGMELVVEMAHDLRSPLSSILMLAEFLKSGQSGTVTDAQRRQLSLIHSAALSLCSTASDVIELARHGNQLRGRAPAPFSVNAALQSVREMVLPIAEEKGLELRIDWSGTDDRLGWDRALSRVLLNLTTNALKYTERGFVELSARDLRDRPGFTEFAVTDSGRGIEAAEMRVLFEPFRERESQRGHQFSSSGLGLAICRKLVAAMDATLQVETKVGKGSRFSFAVSLPPSTSWSGRQNPQL